MNAARLNATLGGVVQGVGFRPFVHRLAHELGLGGWVQNRSGQVAIVAEGPADQLAVFVQRLQADAPPLASPQLLKQHLEPIPEARSGFSILESSAEDAADIHLPPDTHLCADCRRELFDPANRRHRYPFINCTQCGPRYTLISGLPYDRARTSMAGFPLCPACRAEYENPADRRFHAEPVACPVCGPQLRWQNQVGEPALQAALQALRDGQILAVKGVGGYHLMCDAHNEAAVSRLRERKHRPSRPFAILFDETGEHGDAMLNDYLQPDSATRTLLRSPQRPIVLIPMRTDCRLAPGIAPGMRRIGAMLPHSPLQALLSQDFGGPLVATSGNVSGDPIAIAPEEAEARLAHLADGFLHHNRPILRPAEDGVWQMHASTPLPIRLGRGEAAQEWRLARPLTVPTLALGGEQKVCIALGWGDRAVVSPHIGDLSHPKSLEWLQRVTEDLCRLYQVQPARIALDAHPGYRSRQWAQAQGLPLHDIWHHHAHASALCAEHPEQKEWLVFAWDGVGLGEDGALWGGEVLRGSPGHWQRVGRLRPFGLPGGEAASRECWRSAAGMLWEVSRQTPEWHPQMALLHTAWQRGLNSPRTSAIGRLFDAASALLDICPVASFEGEGPMRLQALAETTDTAPAWPVVWRERDGLWELDWEPWLDGLLDTRLPVATRARALHLCVAQALGVLVKRLALPENVSVGVAGGVFQNTLLLDLIAAHGQPVRMARRQPTNDGGLALGQLIEISALTPSCA